MKLDWKQSHDILLKAGLAGTCLKRARMMMYVVCCTQCFVTRGVHMFFAQ